MRHTLRRGLDLMGGEERSNEWPMESRLDTWRIESRSVPRRDWPSAWVYAELADRFGMGEHCQE